MPHNTFKKLPVCSGMSRNACLDFDLGRHSAGAERNRGPRQTIKGGVWSFDLDFLFGRAAGQQEILDRSHSSRGNLSAPPCAAPSGRRRPAFCAGTGKMRAILVFTILL
ncbi:MAG TPA: hypothetical protein VFN27_14490, partial [Xanthobacteraceae bacterium]|nr:hypothetical protein [Xanthobacteraceae bacterium]